MYYLVDVFVSGISGSIGWLISLFVLWHYKSPRVLSLAYPLETLCSVQWLLRVHTLYLTCTSRASQVTDISCYSQHVLVGIDNSVWVLDVYGEWITRWGSLWMAFPSDFAAHFVSVFPTVDILFPLLRRIRVATLCSFFFLGII